MSRLDSTPISDEVKAFIRECAFEAAEVAVERAAALQGAQIAARFAEHERDCPGRTAGKAWSAMTALLSAVAAAVLSSAAVVWFLGRDSGGK